MTLFNRHDYLLHHSMRLDAVLRSAEEVFISHEVKSFTNQTSVNNTMVSRQAEVGGTYDGLRSRRLVDWVIGWGRRGETESSGRLICEFDTKQSKNLTFNTHKNNFNLGAKS